MTLLNEKVFTILIFSFFSVFNFVDAEIWINQRPPWLKKFVYNFNSTGEADASYYWYLNSDPYFYNFDYTFNVPDYITVDYVVADCDASCAVMGKRCNGVINGQVTFNNNVSYDSPISTNENLTYLCSHDTINDFTGIAWTREEYSSAKEACGSIGKKLYSEYSTLYPVGGVALCMPCGCNAGAGSSGCSDNCSNDSGDVISEKCTITPVRTDFSQPESCGRDFSLTISPSGDEDDESTEEVEGWGCPPFNEEAIVKWKIQGIFNQCIATSDNVDEWNGIVGSSIGKHDKDVYVNTLDLFLSGMWESFDELFPHITLKCLYTDEEDNNSEKYIEKTLMFTTSIYDPPPASISVSVPDNIRTLPVTGVVNWNAGEFDLPKEGTAERELYEDDGTGHIDLNCGIKGVNIDTGHQVFSSGGNKDTEVVTFDQPGSYFFTIECDSPPNVPEGFCFYEGIYGSTYAYIPDVPPTVTLSASPNPVDGKAPLKTTVTWDSNYANSCSLNFSPKTDVSGSDVVSREGGSGNKCALKEGLTASCTGDGGVGEASTTAEFKFKPDIKVNQKEITTNDGKKFVLYDWTAKNVTMCTVSEFSNGKWSDPSCSVGACRNDGGSGSLAQDSCVQVVCAGSGGAPVSATIQNGSCTPKSTGLVFCVK